MLFTTSLRITFNVSQNVRPAVLLFREFLFHFSNYPQAERGCKEIGHHICSLDEMYQVWEMVNRNFFISVSHFNSQLTI